MSDLESKLCHASQALTFIDKHRDDAEKLAREVNVPVENILGLAAEESLYGTGRIAKTYNNFFSMHAPAPFQTGEAPALGNNKVKVAIFLSFYQSGQSFLQKFGPKIKSISDPLMFGQALVNAGYNSGDASTGGRPGFARYLADIIWMVKQRMACVK